MQVTLTDNVTTDILHKAGEVIDVSASQARRLVELGVAKGDSDDYATKDPSDPDSDVPPAGEPNGFPQGNNGSIPLS